MSSCSYFPKQRALLRDQTQDYKHSNIAEPLKVPKEYYQPNIEPLYPIPGID